MYCPLCTPCLRSPCPCLFILSSSLPVHLIPHVLRCCVACVELKPRRVCVTYSSVCVVCPWAVFQCLWLGMTSNGVQRCKTFWQWHLRISLLCWICGVCLYVFSMLLIFHTLLLPPSLMFRSRVYALCILMCLQYLHFGINCVQCVFVVANVYVQVPMWEYLSRLSRTYLCLFESGVCMYSCPSFERVRAWLFVRCCPLMWLCAYLCVCVCVCVCVNVCRCVHPGLRCHGAREAGGQHGEDGRSDRRDPHVHHHPPRRCPHLQTQVSNKPVIGT